MKIYTAKVYHTNTKTSSITNKPHHSAKTQTQTFAKLHFINLILKQIAKRGCQIVNFLLQYVKFESSSRQTFHVKPLARTATKTIPTPLEAPLTKRTHQIKVISYEGSSYRTDFWEGQGREFENRTERKAIRRLLPKTGDVIIEIGAGFGRLADLYQDYDQIILLDYSLSLLMEAQKTFGADPKYKFIAANVYNLPLANNLVDTAVMIRVAHHLESPDDALDEIHRILRSNGVFIMEFANKRNAKAIARYLLQKQKWSPFTPEPYEFVPLNFDFHPKWMRQALARHNFRTEKELSISNFRLSILKKHISPETLARIDNAIAGPGALLKLSPSILTKNIAVKPKAEATGMFICPKCKGTDLEFQEDAVICSHCGESWPIISGIVDFRYPRPETIEAHEKH